MRDSAALSSTRRPTIAPAVRAAVATFTIGATCLAVNGVTMSARPAAAAVARTAKLCTSAKRPRLAARLSSKLSRALAGREDRVGFSVADPRFGLTCALNTSEHFDAASVIKVTIISALLLKTNGPRHLSAAQRRLAWLMITESDNDAATDLWNEVGMHDMQRFLNHAGMRHTVLADAWGLSQLTAADELTLLELLANPGRVLSTASRSYVLWLMYHVEAGQRWGVPAGAPRGVKVSVKNGWLPYPVSDDWHVNSIGVFLGHQVNYQIAFLTSGNPNETYGIDTIEAAAEVINAAIARASWLGQHPRAGAAGLPVPSPRRAGL